MSAATTARNSEPTVRPLDVDRLDLDAFRDARVAVLGFARSGVALARFLSDRGARVTVYDAREADALAESIAALEGRDVRLLLGAAVDPADALLDQSLVATSPSVNPRYPTTEPRLRDVLLALEDEGRVPVVSEVDLFLRLCPATTIGVTGTKGKTTTSSLIAAVLAAGDAPVVLGGNIGLPLVERLPELTRRHRVVLELSELQLPTLSRGTDVAVYTHVTSDHLDRHGTLEAYRAAKRRLLELLRPTGTLVVNGEDEVTSAWPAPPGVRRVVYRRSVPDADGAGISDGWVVAGEERILPLESIPLPGRHNVSNVLAAVAVARVFDVPPAAIAAAVAGFAGVEHRLEPVRTIDGVRFVNDSQGTQPDAVVAALRSFEPPIVLIAGGRDKGVPLDELARVAAERAAGAVLIGESAEALQGLLRSAGVPVVERAPTLEAAVQRADVLARRALAAAAPGSATATVLLSPAAASFDMFEDYAARGRAFKAAVAELANNRGEETR